MSEKSAKANQEESEKAGATNPEDVLGNGGSRGKAERRRV